MNVGVCSNDIWEKDRFAQSCLLTIKELGLSCRVAPYVKPEEWIQELKINPFDYQLFIVNADNVSCLKAAHEMRNGGNMDASFIFVSNSTDSLQKLLPLRPSYYVSSDRADILKHSIKWCFQEQLYLKNHYLVYNKSRCCRIPYRDIIYFESNARSVTVHTGESSISFNKKLSDVQERIPEKIFVRCGQSYLVNVTHVREFDRTNRVLYLDTGAIVSVSASKMNEVLNALKRLA